MGGKPQKPKIQAYVEQRWFDEFEVYRSTHNLNQSRALEKILAEFFGGSSNSTSPPDGLDTSTLFDALRAELVELRYELDQRLQIVESKLGLESAAGLHGLAVKSADRLVMPLVESAFESVYGLATSTDELTSESVISKAESARALNGLADESAGDLIPEDANPVESLAELDAESAAALDEAVIESVDRLANISAGELTLIEATTAMDESAESAANPKNESAGEEAIAADTLGGIPESTAPSSELAEVVEVTSAVDTSTPISEPVAADNIVPENPEAPTTLAIKSGKQPTVEVRQILKKKLAPGQTVNKPELAALIGKTPESVRLRVKNSTLHEWGIRRVPGSKLEMFELM